MIGRRRDRSSNATSGLDVWRLLEMRSTVSSDRPYLIWQPTDGAARTWSFRDLHRDASAVAAGLARRGVGPGDRVVLHLDNCPEFVIAWFACAAIGATAVATNTRSAGEELGYLIGDSAAVGAITQPDLAPVVAASAPGLRWIVEVGSTAGPGSFRSLLGDPDDLVAVGTDPSRPMSVQYTSGTTSRPKGVVWTHANAIWAARVNAAHEDLRSDDCFLTYLPLFHANALGYQMLASLWVGARFVLVPKWSTSRFWDVSMRHGCTWLSLIGLSYRAIKSGAAGEVPAGHRYRLFGSGYCDTPLGHRLGVKTIGWWGMTETVSQGIIGNASFPDRVMSMGRPAPEYRIAVVGDDRRTPVEPGGTGHLLIKGIPGISLFACYLNQEQATADAFDADGWFSTGDLATLHDDGYLTFADREKDMLKVGAENVAASEIERVILATGVVAEVAVVGRPDHKLDEVPVAFVIPAHGFNGDTGAILAEACGRALAGFKVPREYYVVSHLPRSTLNKVNKSELRAVSAPDADRAAALTRWRTGADPSLPEVEALIDG